MQEGPQYNTLLRLLRVVCLEAGLDEVLPDPPAVDLAHRYVQVRAPTGLPRYDDPDVVLTSDLPPGLLVRRTTLHKRVACTLHLDACTMATHRTLYVPYRLRLCNY